LIPALLGAFVGAFVHTGNWKARAKIGAPK
jgi:hypothetical protein